MELQNIISEIDGNVGIITLNRPRALNAVCEKMLEELSAKLLDFSQDDKIAVIVLKGSDKAFAAGIDMNELQLNVSSYGINALDKAYECFKLIESCKKPIVAAVAGYALGIGCDLALACDIIFAADNARFAQPGISLGLIPGFGASQRLAKTIGKAQTMDMLLTGRALTADEALVSGLVSRIVPLPDLFDEALKTAQKIASFPQESVAAAKDAVKFAFNASLESGIAYENKNCKICLDSDSFKESLLKFMEKNKK